MTDTNRWPLIAPRQWMVDTSGYEIRDGYIARRGGELRQYALDDHQGLHKVFLDYSAPRNEDVVGLDGDGDPILCGDDTERLLDFVGNFGLLGIAGDSPDAREPVEEFHKAHRRMGVYVAFAHKDPGVLQEERADFFNRSCPPDFKAVLELVNGRTIMKFQPKTLLAWMWLQLAKEIDGGSQPIICQGCGKHFYIGLDIEERTRVGARFCSNSCYLNWWKRDKRKKNKTATQAGRQVICDNKTKRGPSK